MCYILISYHQYEYKLMLPIIVMGLTFADKTSCGLTTNSLLRASMLTDGTFLVMMIGHPYHQSYPVSKGNVSFMCM